MFPPVPRTCAFFVFVCFGSSLDGSSHGVLCCSQAKKDLLEKHYAEHKGKPFFDSLIQYMQTGPTLAAVRSSPLLLTSPHPLYSGIYRPAH